MEQLTVEELLQRKEELLAKIAAYNDQIFNEEEITKTEEFNEEYQSVQNEYEEIEEQLLKLHYKEPAQTDSFLNHTSVWLWIFLFVLFVLSLYPLFNVINLEILIKIISVDGINEMSSLQKKTLLLVGYFAYPVGLLLIDAIVGLFFLKTKENKKVFLIGSVVFLVSLLVSVLVIFFNLILETLKEL